MRNVEEWVKIGVCEECGRERGDDGRLKSVGEEGAMEECGRGRGEDGRLNSIAEEGVLYCEECRSKICKSLLGTIIHSHFTTRDETTE